MRPRLQPLAERFRERLGSAGVLEPGDGVVVALSGGGDSVALLHLLRFTKGLPVLRLAAAHVDHGMRSDSGNDAAWVRGLCQAWGVPCHLHRLDPPPTSEARARKERYRALEGVRLETGARWVVTAHHADDQAETVLFRAVRGTGLGGLQGIRERRGPAIWRPLLPFTRAELRAYATAAGLGWREDPTNRLPMARNVLRHQVLPALERDVSPGARVALAGLARRARWDREAWDSAEPILLRALDVAEEGVGVSVSRDALLALHPRLRGRLLRALAGRVGPGPDEAGTRRAVEFTSSGLSGASVPLGGGVTLSRELGRFLFFRQGPVPREESVSIPAGGVGEARLVVGGATFMVVWRAGSHGTEDGWIDLPRGRVAFPLAVRGRRPGDRVRLSYGTKKLKKVLLEARVPSALRDRTPVVVVATGREIWVPGVVRAADRRCTEDDEDVVSIGIIDASSD